MLKNDLHVSILQYNSLWEDAGENRKRIGGFLHEISPETDILLFPEMFLTGFTMDTSHAESMDGVTVSWMKAIAQEYGWAVAGTLIIRENGHCFNRMVWCEPNGKIITYDKKHLFRMGEEDQYYTAGNKLITINYKGWKIRPFTCYDLRFPVWMRNTDNAYDLLINFANWPAARIEAFITLLKARAIENQCFVIGVNRVGKDGNGIDYPGNSLVIDPKGKCLLAPLPEEEKPAGISLNYQELINFRDKFPVWKDQDSFNILMD